MNSSAERSRAIMPKGLRVRKVRASQGRVTDNVSHEQSSGKCNRNRLPKFVWEKVERWGKSPPTPMVT